MAGDGAPAASGGGGGGRGGGDSPFARAMLTIPGGSIPLREYAVAYLRHHYVLDDTSPFDDNARKLALKAMASVLKVSYNKVRYCLQQFRKTFYKCMVDWCCARASRRNILGQTPYWVQLLEKKLNMLPRALEEVSVHRACKSKRAGQLTPGGALRLIVAYCRRHRALCSSSLYNELRLALRCGAAPSELHAVWVSAQRVCVAQLAALCRAGDAPPPPPAAPPSPAAWRVADLVLTYTDLDAHRLLTDESVNLYDELQALTTLFSLVQKHRVEDTRSAAELARSWTSVYREYTASGKLTSIVVLQRRWHELKLQTRARLAAYWRDGRARPAPALLHVDIAKKFPHVVRDTPVSWRQLVAQGLITATPLEDEPSPGGESTAAEDSDGEREKSTARDQPADNQDDDVQLIERQVETIDVDSESDIEDRLVIDVPTDGDAPTQNQRQVETITSTKEEARPSNDKPNEATSNKISENPVIIAPKSVRQLINVASVESINNRFQESVNRQASSNKGPTNEVPTPNDSAAPSTRAVKDIDTGQTLAILQKLDPSKLCTEIIFESDSDDGSLDTRTNDQNTSNGTQIVISNVTSRADDVTMSENVANINYINKEIPNTSVRDDTTKPRYVNTDSILKSTGEAIQVDSVNRPIASALNITVNIVNDTTTAMEVDNESDTNADVNICHNNTRHVNTNTASKNVAAGPAVNSKPGITDKTRSKVICPNDIDMTNEIVTEIKIENTARYGETSDGSGDKHKEVEENSVDPKLIMETRVDVVRLHETASWRRHSIHNKYININRINMTALQPTIKSNENVFIEIEINDIAKPAWHGSHLVKSENAVKSEHSLANDESNSTYNELLNDETVNKNYKMLDHKDINMGASDLLSAYGMTVSEHGESFVNYSNSSDDSSEDDAAIAGVKRIKPNGKGAKQSIAAGIFEWSSNYEKVFSGDGNRVSRKHRGTRRRKRVAKRVQLPDIEEVRRVNSNILTAQVAPITAGDSVFDVEDCSSNDMVGTRRPADQTASSDKRTVPSMSADKPTDQVAGVDIPADQVAGVDMPADQVAGVDMPSDQVAGVNIPADQVAGVDMPADQVAGVDMPADQVVGADSEWPGGQVPSRRELIVVLNKLTTQLRQRGLSCGLPAPEYCCAARRHRSVNDARRRICASAPEIQLHEHGAGACDCCCRHVLQAAEQRAQLHDDVTRLERDLHRLLHASPSSNGSSKQTSSSSKSSNNGSSKNNKKSCSKKKSNVNSKGNEETANADPLAEWERQKTLNAKYFHISAGNIKRRSATTDKDSNTERTPTSNTEPIDGTKTPQPSDIIEAVDSTNSMVVMVPGQGNGDKERSQTTPESAAAVANVQSTKIECGSEKNMKLATGPTLVVTKLRDPKFRFSKLVKLHTKPYSLLKPIKLTPIRTRVGSLNSMLASRLVTVPSSAASSNAGSTGVVTVPSSVASSNAGSSGVVTVPSSVTSSNAGSSGVVTVPSSATGSNAGSSGVVTVRSSAAGNNTQRKVLLTVPTSVSGLRRRLLVTVPTSTASVSVLGSELVAVPSSAASSNAGSSGVVTGPTSATSVSAVSSGIQALPSSAASVSAVSSSLVTLASGGTSVSTVASAGVSTPVVQHAIVITEHPNHVASTAAGDSAPLPLIPCVDAGNPPGFEPTKDNITRSLTLPTHRNITPDVCDSTKSDVDKENSGVVVNFTEKVSLGLGNGGVCREEIRVGGVCDDTATKIDIEKVHSGDVAKSFDKISVEKDSSGDCAEKSGVTDVCDNTTIKSKINPVSSGVATSLINKLSVEKDDSGDCSEKNGLTDVYEDTTFKIGVTMGFLDNNIDDGKSNTAYDMRAENNSDCEVIDDGDEIVILDSDDEIDNRVNKDSLSTGKDVTAEVNSDIECISNINLKAERSRCMQVNHDTSSHEPQSKIRKIDGQNLSVYDYNDCMLYNEDTSERKELLVNSESDGFSDLDNVNNPSLNGIKKLRIKKTIKMDRQETVSYTSLYVANVNLTTNKDSPESSEVTAFDNYIYIATNSSEVAAINSENSVTNELGRGHMPAAATDASNQLNIVNYGNNKCIDKNASEVLTISNSIGLSGGVVEIRNDITPASVCDVPIVENTCEHVSSFRTYAKKTRRAPGIIDLPDGAPINFGNNDLLNIVQEITKAPSAALPLEPSQVATFNIPKPSEVTTYSDIIDISEDSSDGTATNSCGDSNIITSETTMPVLLSAVSLANPSEVTMLDSDNRKIVYISEGDNDVNTKRSSGDTDLNVIDAGSAMPVIMSTVSLAQPNEVTTLNNDANQEIIVISEGGGNDLTATISVGDRDLINMGGGLGMPVLVSAVSLTKPSEVTMYNGDEPASGVGTGDESTNVGSGEATGVPASASEASG